MSKHIFVVGSSRSGTTMMGRMLGSHKQVFTFHELHFFEQMWDPTSKNQELPIQKAKMLGARLLTVQKDGYFTQSKPDKYLSEVQAIFEKSTLPLTPVNIYIIILDYVTQSHGKQISCEQTPRNVFYLQTILDMLPESKVIIMVRDPRDVMLSQKRKWRRRALGGSRIPRRELIRFWANYHPLTMGILWNSALKSSRPFKNHPRVYFQSFEDLLANPEAELQTLCAFLELPFTKKMLEIPQSGSSHQEDRRGVGIDATTSGRWQHQINERTDVFVCERVTQKNMIFFGYAPSGWQPSPIHLLWVAVIWPVKSVLAFLLNMKRVRNLRVSVIKRLGLSLNSKKAGQL